MHVKPFKFLIFLLMVTQDVCGGEISYVNTYLHPHYGEVSESDQLFILMREECRSKYFSGVVEVEGQRYYGHDQLFALQRSYYTSPKSKTNIPPEYIVKIDKMHNDFVDCIVFEKKYKLIRIDMVDTKTQKVISSTDMTDARSSNVKR